MNTRPLIEMAITDAIRGISSTAATSTSDRKYRGTIKITPGLERPHTAAQAITVSGTMKPYKNRRAATMAMVVLAPGWIRFITSLLYPARIICNQIQITGARCQRTLWRARSSRTSSRMIDIYRARLKAAHQLVGLNLSYHTSEQPQLHRLGSPRQLGNPAPGVLNVSWYTRRDNHFSCSFMLLLYPFLRNWE